MALEGEHDNVVRTLGYLGELLLVPRSTTR